METSVFFAKLFGPIYIIVVIGILLNLKSYRNMMEEFVKNPSSLYLGGIIALFFGFLIVLLHNVWMAGWPVIITILGWLAIIKGACLIICPNMMARMSKVYKDKTALMVITLVVFLALGGFLTAMGYFAG
jgi:hypothetical protein